MSNHNDKKLVNSVEHLTDIAEVNTEPSETLYYAMRNKPKAEQTANAKKYPQGFFNAKPCRKCGATFIPKAPSEMYCSDACKDFMVADRYLRRNYGIGQADYNRMHAAQNGKCAICGGEGFVMKGCHNIKLVLDHCHKTQKPRGLLCHNCNRALGLFKDSKNSLEKAIKYLEGVTTIS